MASKGGGSVTPIRFAPIFKLVCSEIVRVRLEDGDSPEVLAEYIQDERGLLSDMPRHQLTMLLADYADFLSQDVSVEPGTDVVPLPPRLVELDELRDLYSIQKQRIAWMSQLERTLQFPLKGMPQEVSAAVKILKTSAGIRVVLDALGSGDELAGKRLDNLSEEHEGMRALLSNARLRQRLLSMFDRARSQRRFLEGGESADEDEDGDDNGSG